MSTVRVNRGVIEAKKLALTAWSAFMEIVTGLLVLFTSPVQFVNAKSGAGAALNVTTVPRR